MGDHDISGWVVADPGSGARLLAGTRAAESPSGPQHATTTILFDGQHLVVGGHNIAVSADGAWLYAGTVQGGVHRLALG